MVKKKDESAGERSSARKTKDRRRGQSRLKGKAKRQYPLELRLQAIREVEEQDRSQEEVAQALGMSKATLCVWLRAYRSGGVEALENPRSGPRAQRKEKADAKSQAHRRAVLQTKEAHPQAGTRRIRDLLRRFEAIGVSEQDVRRILHEAGLISRAPASVARPQPERRFERAQPNQLWQSDIFTFLRKTLWTEFLSRTVFSDFADCQRRFELWVHGYNFQRPHQALDGLVPADRYFRAAPHVREAVERNVADNARRLALEQPPRKPFYLVGQLGDRNLSIAAEGNALKVKLGDAETETIQLEKEEEHEVEAPARVRSAESEDDEAEEEPQAEGASDPEVAGIGRAGGDRSAPLPDDLERAQRREAGDRGDQGSGDHEAILLSPRAESRRSDARGSDAERAGPQGAAFVADPWGWRRRSSSWRRRSGGWSASCS